MKFPKDIPGKVLCFLVFTYGLSIWYSPTKAIPFVSTGVQVT